MDCTDENGKRLREGQFCTTGETKESNALTYPADVSGSCNGYIGQHGRNKKGQRILYAVPTGDKKACAGGDLFLAKEGRFSVCVPPSPKGCALGEQVEISSSGNTVSPDRISEFYNGNGIIDNINWGTTPEKECPDASWAPNTDIAEFQGSKTRTFITNPGFVANPGLLRYVTWKDREDITDGSTLCIYDGTMIQPKDLDKFKNTDGYKEAGRYACLVNNRISFDCPTYQTEQGPVTPSFCHILAGNGEDSENCREWARSGGSQGWDSGANKLFDVANDDIGNWCSGKDPVKQPDCGCIQRQQSDIFNTLFSSNPGALWQWYIPCDINNQNLVQNRVRKQGQVKKVCEQVINISNIRDSNISLNNVRQVTSCDIGDNGGDNGGDDGGGTSQGFFQSIGQFFRDSPILAWSIVGGVVLLIVVIVAVFLF